MATAALAAALLWNVLALVRLWRDDAEAVASPLVLPSVPMVSRRSLDDPGLFSLASARAPFGVGTPAVAIGALPSIPVVSLEQPRLTGTVVQGSNSFVVVELSDGTMRLMRMGEHAAGMTLRGVSPGSATFTDSTGHRIVLRSAPTETARRP